jgi:class 3 adenylate cyclase
MTPCAACGGELRGDFRFCPFCGWATSQAAPAAGARERKVVTVLFCDLVGFTAASEGVDPEDVEARLRRYYGRLRDELEAFGGTVEKFIGDAVTGVFGAPRAHEDDPERAVRAGLRVIEAISELNEADPGLALRVRVGVNTGDVLVLLDPKLERGEGLVTGDVVNTAARIQAAAPVDGVAVGFDTYRRTESVFVYEELAPVEAKGKSEPVRLFRAVEPRRRLGGEPMRAHHSPFVGREVEQRLLRGLLERCARDSSTQLVTLVGEPGVGKSRLVAELAAHVDSLTEVVTWRQGRCLPYGEGITFWALGEVVKAHAGIYETDSSAVAEQTAGRPGRARPGDPAAERARTDAGYARRALLCRAPARARAFRARPQRRETRRDARTRCRAANATPRPRALRLPRAARGGRRHAPRGRRALRRGV